MSPPPGWYSDPSGTTARRYWDGMQWTGAVQASPVGTVTGAPAPASGSKLPWIIASIAIVLALAALLTLWGMRPSRQGQPGELGQPGRPAAAAEGAQEAFTDKTFAVKVQGAGIPLSEDEAVTEAKTLCRNLEAGEDFVPLVAGIDRRYPALEINDAVSFSRLAIDEYCPGRYPYGPKPR